MQSMDIVTISMGKPITAPSLIPVLHSSTPNCIHEPFMVDGVSYRVTCLSFHTPHGVVFVDDIDGVDISSLGSALGMHELFPKGASIVFVKVLDEDNLQARLWHRDAGEAVFSSEAACAAVTTAIMLQKIREYEADIHMGGRAVHVQWDRRSNNVYLTGPADLIRA